MALFENAYKKTITAEGGYAKAFTGSGETYMGIDRNHAPAWAGWKILDRIKNKKQNQFFPNPQLEALVKNFYKSKMWDQIRGDQIKDQQLANMLFDFYFHKPYVAIEAANTAAIEAYPGTLQVSDSKLTLNVIDLMNDYPAEMFAKIQALRLKHYNNEWKNDKYKTYYSTTRKGLLKRANKFSYNLSEVTGILF